MPSQYKCDDRYGRTETVEEIDRPKKLPGFVCLVWKDGKIIYEDVSGVRNLDTQEPMSRDTIFRIASMTKPITSVLAMMLWEEKKFELDDPITRWFPQFSDMKVINTQTDKYEDAHRLVTVMDLLTHRAGFTYSGFQKGKLKEDYDRVLGADIDSACTNEEWISGLARLPLVSQPGALFNYGKSTDLLGLLISKIENKSLSRVMKEKIFNRLGMTDSFFNLPAMKKNRRAVDMGFDDSGNLINLETVPLKMALSERPANMEFEAGSGGLWSTAYDFLQFAKIFVENGSSKGVGILKPETIRMICSNQLTEEQRQRSTLMGSAIFKEYYGFGLGLATALRESSSSIPCSGSVNSVGWPGAYGGWWSADPVKKSVSIFLTHSMAAPGQLARGIGFELYEAIDLFSNYSRAIISSTV